MIVKPIVFPDDTKKVGASDKGPRPLVFDEVPKTKDELQYMNTYIPATKLFVDDAMDSRPSPAKQENQPKKTVGAPPAFKDPAPPLRTPSAPKSVFAEQTHALHNSVMAEMQKSFASVVAQDAQKVERHIKQLLPLTAEKATGWAEKHIRGVGQLVTASSAIAKRFSAASGEQLMAEALEEANGSGGLFKKLMRSSKGQSNLRPQLAGIRAQIGLWLPECEKMMTESITGMQKVSFSLASLSAVRTVYGDTLDALIAASADTRRVVLQQALTQLELTRTQMEQLRATMLDQVMRMDQLLNITLPAIDAAKKD